MKFSKIGSLREDPKGNFFVGPYVDPSGTAYPKHRAAVYEALNPRYKGPFSSVSDWYNAMAELNRNFALKDPELESDREATLADYELLAELSGKIVVEEYRNGPFVINHNDLTVQNILVGTILAFRSQEKPANIFRLTTSSTSLAFLTFRAQSYPWPHYAYFRGYLVIISLDWSRTVMPISMYLSTGNVSTQNPPCNHASYEVN